MSVKPGDALNGVIACVVIVAGEITLLPQQSPRGHGGAAGDFQELALGQHLLALESAQDVLELKEGGCPPAAFPVAGRLKC